MECGFNGQISCSLELQYKMATMYCMHKGTKLAILCASVFFPWAPQAPPHVLFEVWAIPSHLKLRLFYFARCLEILGLWNIFDVEMCMLLLLIPKFWIFIFWEFMALISDSHLARRVIADLSLHILSSVRDDDACPILTLGESGTSPPALIHLGHKRQPFPSLMIPLGRVAGMHAG